MVLNFSHKENKVNLNNNHEYWSYERTEKLGRALELWDSIKDEFNPRRRITNESKTSKGNNSFK